MASSRRAARTAPLLQKHPSPGLATLAVTGGATNRTFVAFAPASGVASRTGVPTVLTVNPTSRTLHLPASLKPSPQIRYKTRCIDFLE